MDSLQTAIKALENGISKSRKKGLPDTIATLNRTLSEIHSIFKLSSLSPKIASRISEILRVGLQPAYAINFQATLAFAFATFQSIYEIKVKPVIVVDSKSLELKGYWECAQGALLSGLMDALESINSSPKLCKSVADTFYPLLCRLYFSASKDDRLSTANDLLLNVYLLMSDSVADKPDQAASLRKPTLLGGARLGYTIWNTRDFLRLEALLELCVNMRPPAKLPQQQIAYYKEVFNPEIFPGSDKILVLLRSGEHWEDISIQAMSYFANLDISFPQTFATDSISIGRDFQKDVQCIYADNKNFLINVPEGDKVDSLKISYTSITDISATLSGGNFSILAVLGSPPRIGAHPMETSESTLTAKWSVRLSDIESFRSSLEVRGLNLSLGPRGSRKLSVVREGIDLGPTKLSPDIPRPTQAKVADMEKLMEKSTPSRPMTTAAISPPIGAIFPPASDDVFLDKAQTKALETVYIDEQGNLTRPNESLKIEGATEIGAESTPKEIAASSALSRNVIPFGLTIKPKAAFDTGSRPGTEEALAPATLNHEDDSEEGMPVSPSPAPKGRRATRDKGPSLPAMVSSSKSSTPRKPPKTERWPSAQSILSDPYSSPCIPTKRKVGDIEDSSYSPESPAKRGRAPAKATEPTSGRNMRTRRYGGREARAARRSAEAPGMFEEIPKAEKKPSSAIKSNLLTPAKTAPRKTAMKNKAGQKPPVSKPRRANQGARGKIAVKDTKILEENEQKALGEANEANLGARRQLRSGRPQAHEKGDTDAKTKGPENVAPTEKLPPKRPAPRPLAKKKAPWDTESFLNKIEGGSPGPAPLPEQLSEVPTFDPVPEPVELEPQTEPAEVEMALEPMEDVLEARVDDLFGSPMPSDDEDEKSTTFVAEYAVPTKGGFEEDVAQEPASLKVIPKIEEVAMIDLTRSPSPKKTAKVEKVQTLREMFVRTPIHATRDTGERRANRRNESAQPQAPKPIQRVEIAIQTSLVEEVKKVPTFRDRSVFTDRPPEPTILTPRKPASPVQRVQRVRKLSIGETMAVPTLQDDREDLVPPRSKIEPVTVMFEWNRPQDREVEKRINAATREDLAIVNVLNRINEENLKRILGKFDATAAAAQERKKALLRGTAEVLEGIRLDSAKHFNLLVDLESDYATVRKKITDEIEAFSKSSRHASNALKSAIRLHNQNGLSRKLPNSLCKPSPFQAQKMKK